jgi:hypothetical protein
MWNHRPMHLLAFAAATGQKRYARSLLQSHVSVQSISLNYLSFPDPALELHLPHYLIGRHAEVHKGVRHSCRKQV